MNVTPTMLMDGKIFPNEPFSRGDVAKEFFEMVKDGNESKIRIMLRRDRFLIYEFDE
jgi:hypothetical protein